jgi:hypothetical protein
MQGKIWLGETIPFSSGLRTDPCCSITWTVWLYASVVRLKTTYLERSTHRLIFGCSYSSISGLNALRA